MLQQVEKKKKLTEYILSVAAFLNVVLSPSAIRVFIWKKKKKPLHWAQNSNKPMIYKNLNYLPTCINFSLNTAVIDGTPNLTSVSNPNLLFWFCFAFFQSFLSRKHLYRFLLAKTRRFWIELHSITGRNVMAGQNSRTYQNHTSLYIFTASL